MEATFGTGIDYDTDTNQVNLNLNLGIQSQTFTTPVNTPVPIDTLNFFGSSIGNQQGSEIDIRIVPVPTRFSLGASLFPDQLIFDSDDFQSV